MISIRGDKQRKIKRRLLPLVPGLDSKQLLSRARAAHRGTVRPQTPPDTRRPKKERARELGII